ncbi:MAG: sugar phosphate isomerase/epimerase [Clostridia bacterium]|nr:sugar phosphate isomerase/epimerase [Clostridia bacterium]
MLEIGVQQTGWLNWEDLDGSFARLKSLGFETVDLGFPLVPYDTFGQVRSFYDQSLEELIPKYTALKNAADKHGISISQTHSAFPIWIEGASDEYNAYMIMTVEKLCAICEVIDCHAIVVHPVTRDNKADEWNTNMELYRALIPTAIKTNVKICLENMFSSKTGRIVGGACADAEEVVRYIDTLNAEAGADVFGYCFDIGHANLVHKNIRHYINTLGHRLTILHIHDNDGQNDLHLAPYTQVRFTKTCANALDWEGFILGLKDIGYRGTLSFETFRVINVTPPELWDASLQYIAAVGKYFKKRILE